MILFEITSIDILNLMFSIFVNISFVLAPLFGAIALAIRS